MGGSRNANLSVASQSRYAPTPSLSSSLFCGVNGVLEESLARSALSTTSDCGEDAEVACACVCVCARTHKSLCEVVYQRSKSLRILGRLKAARVKVLSEKTILWIRDLCLRTTTTKIWKDADDEHKEQHP